MTEQSEEIEALLARLRSGDEHALAELFSHYRAQLDRMVSLRLDHRLGGRVSASDVLQESYLDAAKRVDHYLSRPEMPFLLSPLRLVKAASISRLACCRFTSWTMARSDTAVRLSGRDPALFRPTDLMA